MRVRWVDGVGNLLLLELSYGDFFGWYNFWICGVEMHPVMVGTIVWVIVGLIVGWLVLRHVARQSPEGKQK